jgi:hypothetical protein
MEGAYRCPRSDNRARGLGTENWKERAVGGRPSQRGKCIVRSRGYRTRSGRSRTATQPVSQGSRSAPLTSAARYSNAIRPRGILRQFRSTFICRKLARRSCGRRARAILRCSGTPSPAPWSIPCRQSPRPIPDAAPRCRARMRRRYLRTHALIFGGPCRAFRPLVLRREKQRVAWTARRVADSGATRRIRTDDLLITKWCRSSAVSEQSKRSQPERADVSNIEWVHGGSEGNGPAAFSMSRDALQRKSGGKEMKLITVLLVAGLVVFAAAGQLITTDVC